MKVLHLFADWKWTGPADPVLDLCIALRERGVDARLAAHPAPPEATTSLEASAKTRGLPLITDFRFGRFPRFGQVRSLRRHLNEQEIDLLHVHLTHDHITGGLAACKGRRPPVLRTNERAVPVRSSIASRFLFRRLTSGYLTYSRAALEADRESFGFGDRAHLIEPGMRLDRFDPATPPMRKELNLAADDFVVGVVARMQRHRRFDVLLEGVRRAAAPGLKVIVAGRGTHMNEVAVEPSKKLGLEKTVLFPGYVREKYLNLVASLDALLFLVPGSDGTCRAVREAMAMGKPVIGARRGMIPELVEDGKTGLVIDDTPDNIAAAVRRLADDRELARKLGQQGRARALERFDVREQARRVEEVYRQTLSAAGAP